MSLISFRFSPQKRRPDSRFGANADCRRDLREQNRFALSDFGRHLFGNQILAAQPAAVPTQQSLHGYFPANSRFTISLTNFPSTRMPAPENLAMAFFITVPMSFMVGEPISAIVAFTPATTSASPAALGK